MRACGAPAYDEAHAQYCRRRRTAFIATPKPRRGLPAGPICPNLKLHPGMVIGRRWVPNATNASRVLVGVAMYGTGKFWSEVRFRQVR